MPGLSSPVPLLSGKRALRRKWEVPLGEHAAALAVHGDVVAAGSLDGRLVLLDAETGALRGELDGHPGGTLALRFSPDGSVLASGGLDGKVRLHSLSQIGEKQAKELDAGESWVEQIAWSSDGELLASGAGRTLRFWTRGGRRAGEAAPHASTITSLFFQKEAPRAVTACYGGIFIFETEEKKPVHTYEWKGSIIGVEPRPDQSWLACATQEESVMLVRTRSGELLPITGFPGKVRGLAWSPNGMLLAASASLAVTLWSFRGKGPEGSKPDVLKGLIGKCTGVAFLDDYRVISSCEDGGLRIHARSGKWKLAAADDAEAPLLSLAVSRASHSAFGSTRDGRLICWNV